MRAMDPKDLIKRMRDGGALTAAEQSALRAFLMERLDKPEDGDDVEDLTRAAGEFTAHVTAYNARQAERANARAALGGVTVLDRDGSRDGADAGAADSAVSHRDESERIVPLGRQVTQSEAFRAFAKSGGRGKVSIDVDGGEEFGVRALFATTNNPLQPQRIPGYVAPLPDQPLTMLDVVDRRPIGTNTVEWVQETTAPNAAAEVTEGAAKPEATFTLTLKTDTTATIAHFVNITRQALDDDLQMRGYIEGRLTFGLLKRLNGQILNGNGTAPNLRGILNTSGLGAYTAGTATEKAIVSIRKAKTVAQLSEYDPDTVVLNPVDWEAVELTSATDGSLIMAPQAQALGGQTPVWGLRPVITTAITGTTFGTTGGTFLVGGMREAVTLWERTGVQIFITDSHASNFTSNILTLLAEMRAALSVWRPLAIVKGTFGASRS
jgi:HK97 family phage major capsid protein